MVPTPGLILVLASVVPLVWARYRQTGAHIPDPTPTGGRSRPPLRCTNIYSTATQKGAMLAKHKLDKDRISDFDYDSSNLKKLNDKRRENGYEVVYCGYCGKKIGEVYKSRAKRGLIFCGKECREKSRKEREVMPSGDRHWRWKGGREVTHKTAAAKYLKTERGKEARERGVSKRRARKAGAEVIEFISRKEILERDGYRCQLCGKKTRPDYNKHSKLYPNVDHIIPLAKGGNHSRDNLQCLCRECNNKKWMNGRGDQLRMFG